MVTCKRKSALLALFAIICVSYVGPAQAKRSLLQGKFDANSISREIANVLNGLFDFDSSPPSPANDEAAQQQPAAEIGAVLDGLLASFQNSQNTEQRQQPENALPRNAGPQNPPAQLPVAKTGYVLYSDTECVSQRVVAERENVESVESCQVQCDVTEACNAFTYNPDTNMCFLVPECSDRVVDPGRTSGVETSMVGRPFVTETNNAQDLAQYRGPVEKRYNMYQDTGCVDGLLDTADNIFSADQCRALCEAMQPCRAYTFNPNKLRCFLAASCTRRENEEGNISGVDASIDPMTMSYNLYERTGCESSSIAHHGDYFSVEECKAWCDRREGCMAFTYSIERRRCWLKRECDDREVDKQLISGVKLSVDECTVSPPCATDDPDMVCPEANEVRGELPDPVYGTFEPPYPEDLDFEPTFTKRDDYPTCNFQPPRDPLPKNWADECIENARGVGFLKERERRPNDECPAGWFLCKGMCYTLVQRNTRSPMRRYGYYNKDVMFIESRCDLCGGARVAYTGPDDPEMEKVLAEMSRQTINDDYAVWTRKYRFMKEPNENVVNGKPYQPWHMYIWMYNDDKTTATYQRYYDGQKDDLDEPGWDIRHRNQEGSVLCVNTIQRIKQAVKVPELSRITMEDGCEGDNRRNKWDDDEHRWYPEKHWPFPGH